MADHAGGRRSVVNLGTKLWRRPVEVCDQTMTFNTGINVGSSLVHFFRIIIWSQYVGGYFFLLTVLAPIFCKTKKDYIYQDAGE